MAKSKISAYHEAIRGIREKTGCTLAEARAKYKHGRVEEPVIALNGYADLTPAKVQEIARANLVRLQTEQTDLQNQLTAKAEEQKDWEGLLAKD